MQELLGPFIQTTYIRLNVDRAETRVRVRPAGGSRSLQSLMDDHGPALDLGVAKTPEVAFDRVLWAVVFRAGAYVISRNAASVRDR